MSHAANQPALNLNLTFDDAAASAMPFFGSLASEAYQPTALGTAPVFSNPAPPGPYTASLSGLNGINPNGLWSLFVEDDRAGDFGGISNGWSLTLTAVTPVNPLADLALIALAPPSPALINDNLTYSFIVTNGGPSPASNVIFTNAVPPNTTSVSASSSQGYIGLSGNAVIGNLGSINAGSTAAVAVVFAPTPAAKGALTNTAAVGATEIDLNPANNTVSTVTTMVLPVADLVVSQTFAPDPVVVGYTLTNTITITNIGTNVAIDVVLTDLLPTNTAFVSASSTAGSCTTTNGLLTCALGNLGPKAGASVSVILTPLAVSPLTSVPVASTASTDPDLTHISVTNSLAVDSPAPILLPAGAVLLSGNGPLNGSVNPGETVTVSLYVTNAGTADTSTNLSATLLDSGGVIPAANAHAVYGAISHGGPAVAQPFTFTASIPGLVSPSQGGSITATLLLQDVQTLANNLQATNYYTNSFLFILPVSLTFSGPDTIKIPDFGPGTPYPSTLIVSGVTGLVSEATVNFYGLSHTFPSDINALLVGPVGNPVLLMAHAGTNYSITNLALSFNDTGLPVPASSQIFPGTYQPTAYNPFALPPPAPPGPYASMLATLDGSSPNGTWALYILDDKPGDSGLLNGWGLTLTVVNPVNPVTAVLGVSIHPISNGQFQLTVSGLPGQSYIIQSSSDLSSWTSVSTNTAAAGSPILFPINPQSASRAFYRVVLAP